jgi:hypothetical protein
MDQLEAGGSCGLCRLQGGILYMQTPRGKEAFNRLCTPEYLRKEILRTCHNEAHSAHLGVFKTTERIVRRFVWKGMYQEIRRYVLSCAECQSRKGVTTAKAGMLQCVKVERPFEKLGIDHLGPFPLSNRGNKHIIVAIDYLTKWVEARAVPSQKAEDVVKFYIEQVYCRHGSVETLASDQGKGFLPELMQLVRKSLDTGHYVGTAYRGQSMGEVERANHVFADMLSFYVSEDQKDWDEKLDLGNFRV